LASSIGEPSIVAVAEVKTVDPEPVTEAQPLNPQHVKQSTVSARAKFFEFEIQQLKDNVKASPTPQPKFQFMTNSELAQMKAEEENKIEQQSIPVRTAKAEGRRKAAAGAAAEPPGVDLSPAEARAVQAEKRAAWRQARLKSLEQDALQAQMVLNRMSEIIENPTGQTGDEEEEEGKVETTEQKIISIELDDREPDQPQQQPDTLTSSPQSPALPENVQLQQQQQQQQQQSRRKKKRNAKKKV
jgi:hypothetical protein